MEISSLITNPFIQLGRFAKGYVLAISLNKNKKIIIQFFDQIKIDGTI